MKKAIRQEMSFQKILHPVDAKERSHLYYCMNEMEAKDLIENLVILLDNVVDSSDGEIACMPNEEETLNFLLAPAESMPCVQNNTTYKSQQPLAIVWHTEHDDTEWYLGFFLDTIDNKTIRVDHLESSKNKVNWIQPAMDDIQEVKADQILSIEVKGDWDFTKKQCAYRVNNYEDIDSMLMKYSS